MELVVDIMGDNRISTKLTGLSLESTIAFMLLILGYENYEDI